VSNPVKHLGAVQPSKTYLTLGWRDQTPVCCCLLACTFLHVCRYFIYS